VMLETIISRVAVISVDDAPHGQDAGKAHEDAAVLWQSMTGGKGADALALLAGYDRDRKGFTDLLISLRHVAESLLLSNSGAIPAIRLLEVVDVIDEISQSNAGNGNVSLLGGVLFARINDIILNGD